MFTYLHTSGKYNKKFICNNNFSIELLNTVFYAKGLSFINAINVITRYQKEDKSVYKYGKHLQAFMHFTPSGSSRRRGDLARPPFQSMPPPPLSPPPEPYRSLNRRNHAVLGNGKNATSCQDFLKINK